MARRFLKDRDDPKSLFQIFRNHRKGYLPELFSVHQGQVYVASCDGLKAHVYKIGKSTDHFSKRSQALSLPTGVPGIFFPVYRFESDLFDQLEQDLLRALKAFRLHRRKEFVECSLDRIVEMLRCKQREQAPNLRFTEHFYYPIEEFENYLVNQYQDFLLKPAPNQWPAICIFLALLTGLPPVDILLKICHQGEELPHLLGGMLESVDVSWLLAYIRSLLRHGHLPFNGDWEADSLDWSLAWVEELLWDAVYASAFLRKIHSGSDLPSTESFCLMLHNKARQYWGELCLKVPTELEFAQERMQNRLDCHFI